MRRRRERGVALVMAVAALAGLTAVAVGLASTAIVDQHLGRNALQLAQAEALARSGIATALVVLAERDPALPDLQTSQWRFGRQPLGAGWVEVEAEDEARRLDVQAAELPQLLALLGLDPRAATALAAPDRDKVLGPFLADRGPAAHLDAAALRRLAPHVTTSGESQVNPHTASRDVLTAVLGDRGLAETWIRARTTGPLDLSALSPSVASRLTTRGQYYRLRSTGGVREARRTLEVVVRVLDGVDPEIVSWRPLLPDAS